MLSDFIREQFYKYDLEIPSEQTAIRWLVEMHQPGPEIDISVPSKGSILK